MPHLELDLAPTAEDTPEMAIALIRAIIAAADKDRDEMTVLLIHGTPAAVIAPYGHERRPGAAVEIRFDQTAPPEARLVLTGTWGEAWAWRSMRETPWNRPAGNGDKIQLFVPEAPLFGTTATGSQYLPYQAHLDPVRLGGEISGEPESEGAWT